MKNVFLIALGLIFCTPKYSQAQARWGMHYTIGASTLIGMKNNSSIPNNGTEPIDFSIKPSLGLAATMQYTVSIPWAFYVNTAYQQRGTKFDKLINNSPAYRLNYFDLSIGALYKRKKPEKKTGLIAGLGGLVGVLLEAERKNSNESVNIKNDLKTFDFGLHTFIGIEVPRLEHDAIQLSVFANTGFNNVFTETLAANGIRGRNFTTGLQLTYLFGKSKK